MFSNISKIWNLNYMYKQVVASLPIHRIPFFSKFLRFFWQQCPNKDLHELNQIKSVHIPDAMKVTETVDGDCIFSVIFPCNLVALGVYWHCLPSWYSQKKEEKGSIFFVIRTIIDSGICATQYIRLYQYQQYQYS